mmetsp:Transcript_104281/g.292151  ORF Transcript_104281/g.292151 Transcript_104281/m.292151 type:complete len:222 (-) Transcript_104281:787-1452(-)
MQDRRVRPPARLASLCAWELGVQELRDLRASVDLRLPLPARPCAHERLPSQWHMYRGAIQRRPLLVPRVPLVAPKPDAGADLELLREGLLQAVLHPHDERLALGEQLFLALLRTTIPGPTRRCLRDHVGSGLHEFGIRLEQVLVPRALQVPQGSPCGVSVGGLASGTRIPREGVGDVEHPDLHESLAELSAPHVRPSRRCGELRQGGRAIVMQLLLLAVDA